MNKCYCLNLEPQLRVIKRTGKIYQWLECPACNLKTTKYPININKDIIITEWDRIIKESQNPKKETFLRTRGNDTFLDY